MRLTPPAFVTIIPARMASSRLPDKPLVALAGVPMIVRVAQQVAQSQTSRIIIATDHPAIENVVRSAGFEVVMTPAALASGTDRIAYAAAQLDLPADTVVVNVQGDEPLLPPHLVDYVASTLVHSAAPMATLAHALTDAAEMLNPNIVKVVTDHVGRALYFSRAPIPYPRDAFATSQAQLPPGLPVARHIGLYAYRTQFLHTFCQLPPAPLEQWEALEQLRALWHGHPIQVAHVAEAPPGGVDTPEDVTRVINWLAAHT